MKDPLSYTLLGKKAADCPHQWPKQTTLEHLNLPALQAYAEYAQDSSVQVYKPPLLHFNAPFSTRIKVVKN